MTSTQAFPANIRLNEDALKTSWKSLEDVFRLRLQKTSSRRLDQDEYVRLSLTSSEDVFKTSWSRPIHSSWPYLFKTSSRRLAKTSGKKVFKTSSRRLQNVLQRYLQDVFRTYIKLNCSCWHVSEKHSTCFWDVLFQRQLSTEEYAQVTLLLINLWSVYKICKRDKNFSSFSFSLYYTF